jgi:PAS domain S-box-containing protein
LGLSITKSLVELHHAVLSLESEPGKGSHFYFELPIAEESKKLEQSPIQYESRFLTEQANSENSNRFIDFPTSISKPHNSANKLKKKSHNYQILAVDDDPVNLETLRFSLSNEGYDIILAHGGQQALEIIQQSPPDLVLLDLMMPHINGFEVCRQIREVWDWVNMPVIILSAKTQLKDLEEGFKAGANDFLTKPFHPKEIIIRVHTQLLAKFAVEYQQDNQLLLNEVEKRKENEIEITTTQKRLEAILNQEKDAILCMDSTRKIVFINQAAQRTLGYRASELLSKDVDILIPTSKDLKIFQPDISEETKDLCQLSIQKKDGTILSSWAYPSAIKSEGELYISLFIPHAPIQNQTNPELDFPKSNQSILTVPDVTQTSQEVITQIQKNRDRIQTLESTLRELVGNPLTLKKKSPQEKGSTVNIKENKLDLNIDNNTIGPGEDIIIKELKIVVVDVMCLALECWEISTGKTKTDLAEESGIWHVNLVDSCYKKTRTMDRYYSLQLVPDKPRIREVIRTVNFVLENSRVDSYKIKLEVAFSRL